MPIRLEKIGQLGGGIVRTGTATSGEYVTVDVTPGKTAWILVEATGAEAWDTTVKGGTDARMSWGVSEGSTMRQWAVHESPGAQLEFRVTAHNGNSKPNIKYTVVQN